jgi:hypothetical protein
MNKAVDATERPNTVTNSITDENFASIFAAPFV